MPEKSDSLSPSFEPSVPDWLLRLRHSAESFAASSKSRGVRRRSTRSVRSSGPRVTTSSELESHADILRFIADACSLEEAIFWHGALVSRLGKVIANLALEPSTDPTNLTRLTEHQRARVLIIDRLSRLLAEGDTPSWR